MTLSVIWRAAPIAVIRVIQTNCLRLCYQLIIYPSISSLNRDTTECFWADEMNHGAPSMPRWPPVMPSNPIMVTIMMEPWVVSLQGAVSMTAAPTPLDKKGKKFCLTLGIKCTSFNFHQCVTSKIISSADTPHLAEWSITRAWSFPNENHYEARISSLPQFTPSYLMASNFVF